MIDQIKRLPKQVFFNRFPPKRVAFGKNGDCRRHDPVVDLGLRLEDDNLLPLILVEGRDAKEGEEKTEEKKLKECLGEEEKVAPHVD